MERKKRIIYLLVGFCFFTLPLCAQTTTVPAQIQNVFQQRFPNAQKIEWSVEGDNYEVEFLLNDKESEAVISKTGKFIEISLPITFNELPQNIKNYHKDKLKGISIDEVYIKTKNEQDKIYVVVTDDTEFLFNQKGDFIKKLSDE